MKIALLGMVLSATSCGPRSQSGSNLAVTSETVDSRIVKLAFLPSDQGEKQANVYAALSTGYTDVTFCRTQQNGQESCYVSETIRSTDSKTIYGISGGIGVTAGTNIAVKAKDSSGQEISRIFSFQLQRRGLRDRLDNGIDNIRQQLTPLPQDKGNYTLTSSTGQRTSLKELFTGSYMLIEASGYNCPYCIQMADRFNRDTNIQNLFKSGRCSKAIVVNGFSSWKRKYGSTFVGKSSFEIAQGSKNPLRILRDFGFQVGSIPSMILVDRSFRIVGRATGSIPREVYDKCK